jgi:hypothetical protein
MNNHESVLANDKKITAIHVDENIDSGLLLRHLNVCIIKELINCLFSIALKVSLAVLMALLFITVALSYQIA